MCFFIRLIWIDKGHVSQMTSFFSGFGGRIGLCQRQDDFVAGLQWMKRTQVQEGENRLPLGKGWNLGVPAVFFFTHFFSQEAGWLVEKEFFFSPS